MEEAENLISALVDHVDAQLVIALVMLPWFRTGRDCRLAMG